MRSVIVTAPVVVAEVEGLKQYFYASPVPIALPDVEVARLVDAGLVAIVDVDVTVPVLVEPSPPVPVVVTPPVGDVERPPRSGSKDAWVDFAVANGVDRELAEASTKAELVAEFD